MLTLADRLAVGDRIMATKPHGDRRAAPFLLLDVRREDRGALGEYVLVEMVELGWHGRPLVSELPIRKRWRPSATVRLALTERLVDPPVGNFPAG